MIPAELRDKIRNVAVFASFNSADDRTIRDAQEVEAWAGGVAGGAFVLTMERKGDVQLTVVGHDAEALKAHAQTLDGAAPLAWQNFGGHWGAHSEHDEERGYSVHLARVLA